MSTKIYVPKAICDEGMKALEEKGFELIGVNRGSPEDLRTYTPQADCVICRVHFFPDELLATAQNLKLFQVHGVGYQDHIVCADAARRGIYVAYSPYGNFNTVAEGAVGLTLAMTKHICEYNDKVRAPGGIKAKMAIELEGATVGLLGLGNIARSYAQKMHFGMGAEIVAYDPFIDGGLVPSYVRLVDTMEAVFSQADVVSLHIPGETSNKDLIDRHFFELMKPTAYFLNTARDILVNNDDLYDALKSGRIAGAAADVNYEEFPDGQKLLTLPNFINTPHAMAFSDASLLRSGMNCVREICRFFLDGQEPKYWVDQKGFQPRT